jgi:hypothetical protein
VIHPELRHFVGLDLGPAGEMTGLAVIQRPRVHPSHPLAQRRPAHTLIHLQRFTLATPYPEIIDQVEKLLRTPPLPGSVFAVDHTGVGRQVLRLFKDSLAQRVTCQFVPVMIGVGLRAESVAGVGIFIPRQELVGTLQVLMQTRRIVFPATLSHVQTLVKELGTFRAKPPTLAAAEKADPVAAWREGPHDDLVLAVALAAWLSETSLPALHPAATPSPRR